MTRVIDGRFELLDRLGGGGMGLVWRARDLVLHREVALKEVRPPDPDLAEYDPEAARALRARVLREAQALARIGHPNVVTIHHIIDNSGTRDAGSDAAAEDAGWTGYPWLVMELVPGGSLQDRLDEGTLGPREAAQLGLGLLAGLSAAHAAGIQHRDIKPANILLRGDGTPVLTDFGIAAVHGATALTVAGSVIGTPDYMAPERVSGQEGGPPADLWSLALTLWVALEGHNPLRRANTLATLAAVLSEEVPRPEHAGALADPLMAVLVRDPEARPSAGELRRQLAAVVSGADPAPEEPAAGGADSGLSAGGSGSGQSAGDADTDGDHLLAPPQGASVTGGAGRPPGTEGPPGPSGNGMGTAASEVAPSLGVFGPAADNGPRADGSSYPGGGPYLPPPPRPPAGDGRPSVTGARRTRQLWWGAGTGAAALAGVLIWVLLPWGSGGKDPEAGPSGSGGPTASPAGGGDSSGSGGSGGTDGGKGGEALTVGVKSDQPGLGYRRPDGTWTGFDIDVARYVANALGKDPADVEFRAVPSSQRESALANGSLDFVVATYTATDARKQQVDFAGPYLMAHQDVLVGTGSDDVKEPGDLDGRTVCSVTGSTAATAFKDRHAPGAKLDSRSTFSQCVEALLSGAVDAVTGDDAVLAGYATGKGSELRLCGFALSQEPYSVGLPKDSPLTGKVQKALEEMTADGTWSRSLKRNLPLLKAEPPAL